MRSRRRTTSRLHGCACFLRCSRVHSIYYGVSWIIIWFISCWSWQHKQTRKWGSTLPLALLFLVVAFFWTANVHVITSLIMLYIYVSLSRWYLCVFQLRGWWILSSCCLYNEIISVPISWFWFEIKSWLSMLRCLLSDAVLEAIRFVEIWNYVKGDLFDSLSCFHSVMCP